ncbi:MAG: glutamyl-tRNA synthetase [Candidatus Sumerlaeota bacterium]|nr:glutamyl-tRNA synthetase [Candidatus Sumerlaeota bacterium]
MTVRVRFAPSPTGFLHVGGARTALYNWLWARKNEGGVMILRIEDTDAERSTDESIAQILDSLRWLGIDWDEGPFFQSRRADIYTAALKRLIASGHAYRAFETPEELEEMRATAMAEGRDPVYDRRSLNLDEATVQRYLEEKRPYVWRFKVPEGETVVPETLLGDAEGCRFENARLGDFALTRSGTDDEWGLPLYNFCCAVDDADMSITHVIRGSDHLTNTARQMMVLNALGAPIPTYTHLPLILKAGKKMSKRDGDADPRFPVSVSARRDRGYLPEATMNFIALLGWSLDDKAEFFSRQELIEAFTLEGLSKSNANFDEDKYLHMNAWYLRNLPREDVTARVRKVLDEAGYKTAEHDAQWIDTIIGHVIERCRLLTEFPAAVSYFFKAPEAFEEKGVKKIFKGDAAPLLREAAAVIEGLSPFDAATLEAALRALAEERGVGFGKIAQPVRLSVTGTMASPGLFDVLIGVGQQESAARMRRAAELIEKNAVPTFS